MNVLFTKLCLILLVLAASIEAQAQTPEPENFEKITDVMPPAPNAAALGKYGGIEVGLNTGAINKSIPVYTFQTSSIQLPIMLSYNCGGFKPSNLPSRAGLDWVMNIGGVVTRTIVGRPDGSFPRKVPPSTAGQDSATFAYYRGGNLAYWDTEPDIYSFNFNGYSGRFLYDENDSIVFLPPSNIKVEKNFAGTTWNFKITTPDGLVYYFGGTSATEKTKGEGGCGKPFVGYEPSSWYLNRIENAYGDYMSFTYEAVMYTAPGPPTQDIYANSPTNPSNNCLNSAGEPSTCPDYASMSKLCGSTQRTMGVLLTKVETPFNGKLIIGYQTRLNSSDKLYSSIKVYNQYNAVTNWFEFIYQNVHTTLFNNSIISATDRPFLMNFVERSSDSLQMRQHKFTYNNLTELPVEQSFSQDHWGFFNGVSNLNFVEKPISFYDQSVFPTAAANKEPDYVFALKGVLSKIQYPTGGYDTIAYEANDYYGTKSTLPTLTLLNANVTGINFSTTVSVNSANLPVNATHTAKFSYRAEINDGSTLTDTLHHKGGFVIRDITASQDIVSISVAADGYQRSVVVYLTAGHTYKVTTSANGSIVTAYSSLNYRPGNTVVFTGNIPIGGIRVKQVSTYADKSKTPMIKRYYYGASEDSLTFSSGGKPATPSYIRQFYSKQVCSSQGGGGQIFCNENTCSYSALQSQSIPRMDIYPSGVTYGTVIVGEGANFENGATEHRFTVKSDQGVINLNANFNGDLIPGRTYFNDSYYNGIETMTTVLKQIGSSLRPLERTQNHLKIDSRLTKDVVCGIVQYRMEYCAGLANQPTFSMLEAYNANNYNIQSRWIYVDTIIKTSYDGNGVAATVQSQYLTYDSPKHLQLTGQEVTNSQGEVIGSQIKYPGDFGTITGTDAISLGVKKLQTLGFQTVPVEKVVYRRTIGSSTKSVIGAKFISFKSTIPAPDSIYQLENSAVITNFAFATTTGGVVTKDARYFKQISLLTYDSRGNLLSQQQRGSQVQSVLYDYNSSLPVAQVVNASSADIGYTSFETSYTGGWAITGGSVNTTQAIAGSSSYNLASGNTLIKSGLAGATAYTVSYWSRNGVLTVTGSGSVVTGPTKNGWTFYMHSVTGVTSTTVSASSAVIDELRVYPTKAQMSTATYIPLVGVSSQSDVNNKVTYYEYDTYNRLSFIRDQDRNIIKRICYNYFGQPENCGYVTYYNVLKSGTYNRTNCGTGVGSPYTYTVPAGIYPSITSQAAADQLAQDDVNANGQIAANLNGVCTYSNVLKSVTYSRTNCTGGAVGGPYTTTIGAGSYTSTVDQATADQLALNAANAVGQSNANTYGTCTWYNDYMGANYTKQGCAVGYVGSVHFYSIAANAYSSNVSKPDANAIAAAAMASQGQANANTIGTCTPTCNPSNCSGVDKKCVGGYCQTGTKVYTSSVLISAHNYECTYHYEWSDGSWSQNYTEMSPTACFNEA